MKIKLVEQFLEESKTSEDELLRILALIGEAHDKIIEAQDELNSLGYSTDDDIVTSLEYDVDDIEASLSNLDFMGDENPVEEIYKYYNEDVEEEDE